MGAGAVAGGAGDVAVVEGAGSGSDARLVVPEPVVPVLGSDGGVLGSGVVVVGDGVCGVLVTGGVCCGVSCAAAAPPIAARAAANAMSFIGLLLTRFPGAACAPESSTQQGARCSPGSCGISLVLGKS